MPYQMGGAGNVIECKQCLTVTMKIFAFVGQDHTVGMPAQVCKFVDNKNQLPSDQLQTLN